MLHKLRVTYVGHEDVHVVDLLLVVVVVVAAVGALVQIVF